ncbi:serine acetyltransferase [Aquimarina mytili]|uniref:Serine acetyltransferase n=2 Tax=Aquimarina mytili TaxID=874423 RepID=A0A937DAX1_9FLAO|nr:serine acetyltransferase [Aquimarina mytili]
MRIFYLIHQLLFLPHMLLYISSKNKNLIREDLYCKDVIPNSSFKVAFDLTRRLSQSKYFRTLFYFRTAGLFSNILRVFYPRDNRFTIDMHTKIDGGVILAHPYSSIINAKQIGKNLYINQLVTVGEKEGDKPTIGDNVKLYTNCTIIGDITIGDNCIIGAGAVVTKSIPKNSVAVGNPAKVIKTIEVVERSQENEVQ